MHHILELAIIQSVAKLFAQTSGTFFLNKKLEKFFGDYAGTLRLIGYIFLKLFNYETYMR